MNIMSARALAFGAALPLMAAAQTATPPEPLPPLPAKSQMEWQQMETYAFIHYGLNTYTDSEWGYGDAAPDLLRPTRLDAEQWASTLARAGMKGVIITAKHHDGFCLWPSRYTDYSVRNTPYRDGQGDIVGELAAAARKYGLRFGIYLSPWDRHQACYATPLYVDYYHAQLTELLTRYGDIFEVWLDGANGGDGWYGGARTKYTIDPRRYYDYDKINARIRELQPGAVIFSDGGPGCRWVGNEKGEAGATNWSLLRSGEVYPGYPDYKKLAAGHSDGDTWTPAECDVSIRPGWFWHAKENDRVKTVAQLTDLYYRSVGRNATMLLNVPVAADGRIHPTDSLRLMQFRQRLDAEFATDLCAGASLTASASRGKGYGPERLTDGQYDTYWAAPDGVTTAAITVKLRREARVSRLMLQEYIPLGQRVQAFKVERLSGGKWLPVDPGEETTTIGYKRLLRFAPVSARAIRVTITSARACPCLNRIAAYAAD